jgi:Zn-dependent protease with chaperone function
MRFVLAEPLLYLVSMMAFLLSRRHTRTIAALTLCLGLTSFTAAQTRIVAPKNRYSVADDVKLGREAAAQAKKELPMLNDDRVDDYVERIGRRLADAVPPEFRHPEFQYTFDVVNQKEINAFALPGGPMFLNRGMIEAAKTEGEVAGVMAHEMSHVALRHGTAQASSGQGAQIGGILGQIAGAIIGGTAGSIISTGSQIGAGIYITKYSRAYESQADILGAQMLARAGYDPREMANMFKTIEAEGGSRGPEWLSSHPNPGNRYNAINKEAATLRIEGNANTGQFQEIQARLASMPPAYTAEQIAKGQARTNPRTVATRAPINVPPPSMQYRTSQPLNFLRLSLPSNWREVSGGNDGVTYAPEGGYIESGDQSAFTHGFQIGMTTVRGSGNLQRDTDALIQAFARGNPQLRSSGGYIRDRISGRNALRTTLSNVSEVTGQRETVSLTTTQLSDGRVLYLIGVAPQNEASAYEDAFRRVRQSIQLSDR